MRGVFSRLPGQVRVGTLLTGLRLPGSVLSGSWEGRAYILGTHCVGLGDSRSEQAQGTSWKKPPLACEVEYRGPWLGRL